MKKETKTSVQNKISCAAEHKKQVCAPVTKEMTIKEVIEKYPKTASVFIKLGLYCFSCPVASEETIEEMAKTYKLDLEKLLEELNKNL
jgi:hybrid cluster-associated redox disulfide protein